MSIRIRTRSGEEIDLGDVRQRYAEVHACYDGKRLRPVDEVAARNAREDLALLDALEAALSVRNKYDPQQDELHYDVADEALTEVRQAAGVIEEGA